MKRFRWNNWVICALFLSYSCVLFAERRLPVFKSDQERIAYLAYLRQVIPRIYQESATHGGDILQALLDQEELEKALKRSRLYQRLIANRSDSLLQLDIKVEGNAEVRSRVIDPKAIQAWGESLHNLIESLPQDEDLKSTLEKRIQEYLTKINGSSADKLQGALLSTVDGKKKRTANISALSAQELMEFLAEDGVLPNNLTEHGFRPEALGLDKKNYTGKEGLQLLRQMRQWEGEMIQLVQAHILLQNPEGDFPDRENALLRLAHLEESNIDAFVDHDTYLPRLNRLSDAIKQDRSHVAQVVGGPTHRTKGSPEKKILPKVISKGLMTKTIKGLTSQKVENVETLSGEMSAFEVPPQFSIFRGCVGGDCSTTHSANAPNAPMERVFFVRDRRGLKGQVSVTIVDIPDGESKTGESTKTKKALYVHTIAGKRISTADTLTLLRGFYEAREALGVEEIVLIHADRVDSNNNYQAVREGFRLARQGMKVVPITYLDAKIREKLGVASYDSADHNTLAYLYKPDNSETKIKATSTTHELPKFEAKPVSRLEVLLFAIDLDNLGEANAGNVRRVLRSLPHRERISEIEFKKIRKALRNKEQLGLEDFYKGVAEVLKPYDIKVDEAFVEDRPYYFWDGHLASADVLEAERFSKLPEPMKERTVEFVIAELTDNEEVPSEVKTVLEENLDYFKQSEKFINYLKRIALLHPPDAQDLKQLHAIFELGIRPEGFNEHLAHLIPLLETANETTREQITDVLGHFKWSPEQVRMIAGGLDSDNPEKVTEALKRLAKIEVNDDATQKRLLELHFEGKHEQYPSPRDVLGQVHLGDEAGKWAMEQLKTAKNDKETELLYLIRNNPISDKEGLLWIMKKYLKSLDTDQSWRSFRLKGWGEETLKAQSPEAMGPAFLELQLKLKSRKRDDKIRALNAIRALEPQHEGLALAVLDIILAEEPSIGRYFPWHTAALDALVAMKAQHPSVHERLAKTIEEKKKTDSSRERAIETLGALETKDAKAHAALVKAWLKAEPESEEKDQLTETLKKAKELSNEHLLQISERLASQNLKESRQAAQILETHKPKDPKIHLRLVEENIRVYKGDETNWYAHSALEKVAPIGPEAQRVLGKALDSKNSEIQQRAARALRTTPVTDSYTLNQLAKHVSNEHTCHYACAALKAAENIPAQVVNTLIKQAQTGNQENQIQVIELLGEISGKNPKAQSFLVQVALDKKKPQAVRVAALESLENYAQFFGKGDSTAEESRLHHRHYEALTALVSNRSGPIADQALKIFTEGKSQDPKTHRVYVKLILEKGKVSRESRKELLSALNELEPSEPRVLRPLIQALDTAAPQDRDLILDFFENGWSAFYNERSLHKDLHGLFVKALAKVPKRRLPGLVRGFEHAEVTNASVLKQLVDFLRDPKTPPEVKRSILTTLKRNEHQSQAWLDVALGAIAGKLPLKAHMDDILTKLRESLQENPAVAVRLAKEGLIAAVPFSSKKEILDMLAFYTDHLVSGAVPPLSQMATHQNPSLRKEALKVLTQHFAQNHNPRLAAAMLPFRNCSQCRNNFDTYFSSSMEYADEVYVAILKGLAKEARDAKQWDPKSIEFFLEMLKTGVHDDIFMRRTLGKLLTSDHANEVALGLHILGTVQTRSRTLREKLFELALHSEEVGTRNLALSALANQRGLKRDRVADTLERSYARGDTGAATLMEKQANRVKDDPKVVEGLTKQLAHTDPAMRLKAIEHLENSQSALNENQLLRVVKALGDRHEKGAIAGRAHKVLLAQPGPLPDKVIDSLTELLDHTNPNVRFKAIEYLRETRPKLNDKQLLRVVKRLSDKYDNGIIAGRAYQIIFNLPTLSDAVVKAMIADFPKVHVHVHAGILYTLLEQGNQIPELAHFVRNIALKGPNEWRTLATHRLPQFAAFTTGIEKEVAPLLKSTNVQDHLTAITIILSSAAKEDTLALKRQAMDLGIELIKSKDVQAEEVAQSVAKGFEQFPDEIRPFLKWLDGNERERFIAGILVAGAPKNASVDESTRRKVAKWFAAEVLGATETRGKYWYAISEMKDYWPKDFLPALYKRLQSKDMTDIAFFVDILKLASPGDKQTIAALEATLEQLLELPVEERRLNELIIKKVGEALHANAAANQGAGNQGQNQRVQTLLRKAGFTCAMLLSLLL